MELTKSQSNGFKLYLMKISKGLFTDVDFFVNYMHVYPELVIMVDVNWDMLPPDRAYNYNLYLKEMFSDNVLTYLKMIDVPFRGRVEFEILNWSE